MSAEVFYKIRHTKEWKQLPQQRSKHKKWSLSNFIKNLSKLEVSDIEILYAERTPVVLWQSSAWLSLSSFPLFI